MYWQRQTGERRLLSSTTSIILALVLSCVLSSYALAAPRLTGSPNDSIKVGAKYKFTPGMSGLDAAKISYSIKRKPSWATFNSSTGRLSGRPGNKDVGDYQNIVLKATDGKKSAALGAFSITVVSSSGNTTSGSDKNGDAAISGSPDTTVSTGDQYYFKPDISGFNSSKVRFSVSGKPPWAKFRGSNGKLKGTPGKGDIGLHGEITITANDGKNSATLGPFAVNVESASGAGTTPAGSGSVTLRWIPPSKNTDDTLLTNLAAYRVEWGPTKGDFTDSVRINNPDKDQYVVENLSPGRYKFAIVAINSLGNESRLSNIEEEVVQ